MTDLMWFLTRSSGVVALVLIVAAVADGLLFSGRNTGSRRRPAWWMDLHRGLGGYALAFTGLHLVTAYGADLGLGLAEVLVPVAAANSTTAYTLGVLAAYGIALTVATSWPKRRLRRRTWHLLHALSLPAAVAAGVHGYQLGSDAGATWYTLLTLALVAIGTYPLALRLLGIVRRRRHPWAANRPNALAGRADRPDAPATTSVTVGTPADAEDDERALVGAGR